MSTLIVGGDRVNTYRGYLLSRGFGPVLHWNGRKNSACHRTIPSGIRLLVIMVDQVNHGLTGKVRRVADELAPRCILTPWLAVAPVGIAGLKQLSA